MSNTWKQSLRRIARIIVLTGFVSSSILSPAFAGPAGGRIVSGDGSISQSGNNSRIDQATDRLIIEWDSFDTTAQEQVRFHQPSSDASVLNRILSGHATVFDGSLFANGNVIIVNGAGIHFGPNSRVDVGSLIASTAGITDSNFLNDRLIFDRPGLPDAMVTNEGMITVRDTGLAALVAPGVENSGLIRANLGTVILGAGEAHTIDFNGDGLVAFTITEPTKSAPKRKDGSTAEALVSNSGTVEADGGSIVMTASQASRVLDNAINMSGVAQANSVGMRNGKIVLFGGGKGRVNVGGRVRASGTRKGQTGGTIHITGEEIPIPKSRIEALGEAGGGTVLIGGAHKGGALSDTSEIGYLQSGDLVSILTGTDAGAAGKGFMPMADSTFIGAEAVIDTSSSAGNGGNVVIWGTEEVYFHGSITTLGGDGGFVEVSTLGIGVIDGQVSTLNLLVDPGDVCVTTGGRNSGCAVGAVEVSDAFFLSTLDLGGTATLDTDVSGTSGTGRVDFGGGGNFAVNNDTGTMGTFIIHAADEINTQQVGFASNGTTGTNYEWYAGSASTVAPVASADVIQGGQIFNSGGGHVIFDAADDISINDPLRTSGGDVTLIARGGVGDATVTIGAFGTATDDHIDTTDGAGNAGAVTIEADDFIVSASATSDLIINANGTGGIVSIRPHTSARSIDLGTDTTGSLSLTSAIIDRIAADVLRIGSADAGNLTISVAISPAKTDTLSLITGGSILDGNATGNDVTVTNLALQAASGIANDDFLETAVTTLAINNASDLVSISNTGALTIGTVDGVSGLTSDGAVDIMTASPLTFAVNLSAGGNLTATAGESGTTNTDNITVNAGVTVQSTGGNVTLQAGDDIALGAGAAVSANGTLTMTAGFSDTDNDGGLSFGAATVAGSTVNMSAIDDIVLGVASAAGGTVDIASTAGAIVDGNDPADGTLNITALNLALSAATGIGGAGTAATLETQVSNLEAQTNTGGIFIDNTGDLTIGGVKGALVGLRAVTAGDIELTNEGRIDINVAGERVVGPAAVTVIANGATADILTGSNTVIPNATVQSSGGTVTLEAGRDLLLGDTAGAGTLGNVFGGGSVVLDAGRDIIVDTGTFIRASGAGTIMANAGRNISVLDTSGPFNGAEIRTEGGDITLTTGAGGVFTANNGASPAVQTTVSGGNGNITISADAMDIRNSILAGTGIVTLQTVTNGQLIDLGGADALGTLGLTDTELDRITAGTLRIGSTPAGSIDLTAAISPANVTTLSLITGDAITDNNAGGADITVANLAMQAVNGIGSADAIDTGVGTVAASNSTSGSIKLLQLTGLGNLTVGTVDGVVGVSNQATTGLNQTRIQTAASNLIINSAVSSAQDALLLGAGGNSLLDNNASISTTAGFGIDLQGASMALEDGTVVAGGNGRVRISPLFAGQAIDLGSTSDAGAALELSDAELDTITAGTLQIGQTGIGNITITDAIGPADVGTLALQTSGAVLDGTTTEQTDLTIENLVIRSGNGVTGLDTAVTNLAFANTGGAVSLNNSGALTIASVDGQSTSSNTGTTTDITTDGLLTFAVDASSTGDATFTAPTITVNNSVNVDVTAGALAFIGTTVNLDGNLTAGSDISGTATTVNVIGSTGGAEIQDGVDVAAAGATVNVGDGTFAGGITIDKALTMIGDGFTGTTTVNVADGTAGMTVASSGVTIDGFLFTGDGTPDNATGVLVDGSGGALANVLIGDANADNRGSRFTGLTTGLQVEDGATGNAIGIEIGLGNAFDTSMDGMVFDGTGIGLTGDTFNDTSFAGIIGDYIRLENGAAFLPGSPTVLDARSVTFDGVLGTAMSVAQVVALEDKLVHYLDDPTLGLINVGQLAVTNGNSIQLAVNAAGLIGGPQAVLVDAGTFGGSVEVWVDDLALVGQGATTIIDTDAVDAFANNGDVNNGFQVAAISDHSGGGDVTGVTIQGFAFTSTTAGANTGVELGASGVSTAAKATVSNNSFNDLFDGIIANNVSGATIISFLTMTDIEGNGIRFDAALAADDTVLIANSSITSVRDAVRFASTLTGADVTIFGNTIEAGSDGLEFAGAIGGGSTVTVAGNMRIEGLGTFIDEDRLGDGIAFRGAISGATTSILIDDNTLIRGLDRGINFASSDTGGPATVTDASITISRNDEIRGTEIDGILFNANLTNATILIGGPTAADGNGLIIGNDEGLDIENVLGGSFTVANNMTIQGVTGDGIEFEGLIRNNAEVTVQGNTTIHGGGPDGISFDRNVTGSTVDISGNGEIMGAENGIDVAGLVRGDTDFMITGNVIGSAVSRVERDGIRFRAGIFDTATVIIGSNQVFATEQAIQIDDLQSPSTVSITGGTYNGTGGALLVDNTGVAGTDGRLNLGTAAYIAGAGSTVLEVLTDAGNAGVDIDFTGAASFTGGATGMRLSGPGIDVLNDTFGSIAFSGQTTNFIELASGAEFLPGSPTRLDATGVDFDGLDINVFADQLAIEQKLVHYLDDPTLGLIDYGALVVPDGASIQLAVNAAGLLGGTQTVTVASGTFGGSVEVWVDDLTLIGQGVTTIIDTDAVDAFANNGDVNNGFQVAAISVLSGGGDVTGVTIDGFAFDTVNTSGTNIGVELGESGVSTATDMALQNSTFNDLRDGIFSNLSDGNTTFSDNTLTAIGRRGINFADAVVSGEYITIDGNSASSDNWTIVFDSTVTDAEIRISGNTLRSTGANDAIIFNGTIANSTVTIGGTIAAEANDIVGFDDGIDIDGIVGGTFTIAGNTRIAGNGAGSGDAIEFDNLISDDADVRILGNGLIQGNNTGISFQTAVTSSVVTIAGNTEISGANVTGIEFGGTVSDSTVTIEDNRIAARLNGINVTGAVDGDTDFMITDNVIGSAVSRVGGAGIGFRAGILDTATVIIGSNQVFATQQAIQIKDLQSPSTVSITGGTYNGTGGALLVDNTGVAGTDGRLNLGTAAYIAGAGSTVFEVLTDAGNAGVAVDFMGAASFTGGATGIRLSGPGVRLVDDTLGSIAFSSQSGNFIELADGALFEPGRPTIIWGHDATYDGISIPLGVSPPLLSWVESRIIDFDDDPTLGQIFFLPSPPADGLPVFGVRTTNVQTPGDWILRPEYSFEILAKNIFEQRYGLGSCVIIVDDRTPDGRVACVAPVSGSDISPWIDRYLSNLGL